MSKRKSKVTVEDRRAIDESWLNINVKDEELFNPLLQVPEEFRDQEHLYFTYLFTCPEYFSFICKEILNIDLLPVQTAILAEFWGRKFPMFIGSRGFGKSFILAVYALLRALLYPGRRIVICGSVFRQSKVIFEYIERIWRDAPILRDICSASSGPRHDVDMWRFHINNSLITALPIGDGCLGSNTLITYNDKIGYIVEGSNETIKKRDRKIYGNGKFNNSDELYNNGYKNTKVVTTKRGYTYEGTYNHKMKIMTIEGIKFVRSDQLENNNYLLIDKTQRWHSGESHITNEQAYAFGLMVGDGCWTDKYSLRFTGPDEELIPLLNKGLNMEFTQEKSDKIHFNTYGKDKVSKFKKTFGVPKLYGYQKYIPNSIMSAKKEVMSAFLRGLFDTDGHVIFNQSTSKGNTVYVGLTTTSKKLAYEVQYILLHYGIICSLKKRIRKRKGILCRPSYNILISGQNVNLYHHYIGFSLKRKQEILETGLNSRIVEKEIENIVPFAKKWIYEIKELFPEIKSWKSLKGFNKKKNITVSYFQKFLRYYDGIDHPKLEEARYLCSGNIFYDKIISIEDSKCDTYDLHVPSIHEYCANGFFSHNSNIRGQRANDIIMDEFASSSEDVFETVIAGFAAVAPNPIDNVKEQAKKRKSKELGVEYNPKVALAASNQIVLAGTAFYSFNHFHRYWRIWKGIIESKGNRKKIQEIFNGEVPEQFNYRDYSVIRIPLELIPEGFMDEAAIARSKATSNSGTYLHEYSACFVTDSDGFFKRSVIEKCVASEKNNIQFASCGQAIYNATLYGDRTKKYVFGIDPAATQDNFAITIIEMWPDHRRIVYCWTTNKQDHTEKMRLGQIKEGDYYSYCVRKIRDLMKVFPCDRLAIDSQGGGRGIIEALANEALLETGELLIFPVENPDKPTITDSMIGMHIIEPINFVDEKFTTDANNSLCSDLENKILLFPFFDSLTLMDAEFADKNGNLRVDTLEDCISDIEEMKNELSTIVVTQTATGRPRWDTPEIKGTDGKKGRLKKDRYSALLMANYIAKKLMSDNTITYEIGEGAGFINSVKKTDFSGPLFTGNQRWAAVLEDLFS